MTFFLEKNLVFDKAPSSKTTHEEDWNIQIEGRVDRMTCMFLQSFEFTQAKKTTKVEVKAFLGVGKNSRGRK